MSYETKVALVTGGGSGIGKATAIALAAEGTRVAVLGRSQAGLEETVSLIERQGGQALALLADISQTAEVIRAYQTLEQHWGRLDMLFANAGINGVWAPIISLDPDEWRTTLDINLTGTFLTIKYAVPALKERGGAIVITSSVNGTRMFSNTGATAYACTKAAQVAMAKMLALELAKDKIRVNVICPGAIETSINDNTDKQDLDQVGAPVIYPEGTIPLTGGLPGSSEDVANLVSFLLSDAAAHVSGTEIWIDGTQSLLQG